MITVHTDSYGVINTKPLAVIWVSCLDVAVFTTQRVSSLDPIPKKIQSW